MTLDTLLAPATHAIEVRHSRFLAQAAPVSAPAAALDLIAAVSDADATHNCWAYRIGAEYRSSDDHEPAGTAGRPILAAIDGQGMDEVVVVVTRWYGGIRLGAGGLVRAYGGAAAECLRRATRRPLLAMVHVRLHCRFTDSGEVHASIAALAATRLEERFDADGVHFVLRLPATHVEALRQRLRDATRDRVRLTLEPGPPTPPSR